MSLVELFIGDVKPSHSVTAEFMEFQLLAFQGMVQEKSPPDDGGVGGVGGVGGGVGGVIGQGMT